MRNGKRVDAELRLMFPPPPPLDQLNEEQLEVVARSKNLEAGTAGADWTSLESHSNLVEMWLQRSKVTGDEKTR